MKKRASKKVCQAEGCKATVTSAEPGKDLCARHERMENASPCKLAHCDRPVYAKELCEAHYRRWKRKSPKWDAPIIRNQGELYFVATRITNEQREALESTMPRDEEGKPRQKMYSKLLEVIAEWIEMKGLHGSRAA